MKNQLKNLSLVMLATVSAFFLFQVSVYSQDEPWKSTQLDGLLDEPADDDSPIYAFSGDFTIEQGSRNGTLSIALDLKSGWHAYPQKGSDSPTTLEVEKSGKFELLGPFTPDSPPKTRVNELGVPALEFSKRVVWCAPIELADGVDPGTVEVVVRASGQVCSTKCIPLDADKSTVRARFSKYTSSVGTFASEQGSFSGQLKSSTIKPGGKAKLVFTADSKPGWHIYKREDFKRKGTTPIPTIICFNKTADFKISDPKPSKEPVGEDDVFFHEGKVSWTIDIEAPSDKEPGKYELDGRIVFQHCTESSCVEPTSLNFKFPLVVGDENLEQETTVALSISEVGYDDVIVQSQDFWAGNSERNLAAAIAPAELAFFLLLAFLAGLILNAMPCVLPVIGLKIMSFVQQAGEKRGRILLLNLVFSLGLLTVFWILATLSAFFGFGWGDWLTESMTGLIIITAIVFAFGLSMLGVWELPIPGLSGSSAIGKKSEEEGLLGAFFLGILTTVLATPCTGPMLIPAITFTSGQPSWVAYLIFTTIGLGMALPYILVGFFPGLISWLPRPGAWMNTFKQITGFILMATVVFLMSSFSGEPRNVYLVAMLTLLLCIAFACWWIGRTSLAAETPDKMKAWGTGLAMIAVGAYLSFTFLGPPPFELDWQQYSKAKLGELQAANRIVFIDFTGPA